MNIQIKNILTKRIQILFFLWLALLMSTCIIVGVSFVLNKNYIPIKKISEILSSPFGLVLFIAGLIIFSLSLSIIKLLIKKMSPLVEDKTLLIEKIKAVVIRNGKTITPEEELLLNGLSLNDVKIFRLFISYMLLFVFRLALAEAVTIIGLQISIHQQSFQIIFPFFALSLVVFITKIPSFETIYADLQSILRTY